MPDCDYCSASFDGEEAYDDHLAEEHYDELGRIDRRRIDEHRGDDTTGFPTGPAILIAVIGIAALLVVYLIVIAGDSGGGPATINGIDVEQTPTNVGTVHSHGTINVTIDGQTLDFTDEQFIRFQTYDAFHFEGPPHWHVHGDGVTLEYAMATLGIEVTDNAVTYDGTTYRDGADTAVEVLVNSQDVDPSTYTLQGSDQPEDGDHIRIVVRTNDTA